MSSKNNIPKYPKLTPQQIQLQNSQIRSLDQQNYLINQQLQTQNLLAPYLYQAAGLKPIYSQRSNEQTAENFDPEAYLRANPDVAAAGMDPWAHYNWANQNGEQRAFTARQPEIIGFEQLPETPEQANDRQIAQLSQERTLAALKGELPVDAGLLSDLANTEKQLNESLTKTLGPSWASSTPGIQAMQEWQKQKNIALDAARRGDLTTAENVNLAQSNFNQQQVANFLNQAAGISNLSGWAPGAYGANAQGYNSPLQWLAQQQQNEYQAKLARALYAPPPAWAGILQGGVSGASSGFMAGGPWGALAGGVIGAGMGAAGQSARGGPLYGGGSGGGGGFGAGLGGLPGMAGGLFGSSSGSSMSGDVFRG